MKTPWHWIPCMRLDRAGTTWGRGIPATTSVNHWCEASPTRLGRMESIATRARWRSKRWIGSVKNHQPEPLEAEKQAELKRILAAADKEIRKG